MNGWNEQLTAIVAAGTGVLLLILLVWLLVTSIQLSRLKQAHAKLVGDSGVPQLADVLENMHRQIAALEQQLKNQQQTLEQQQRRLSATKGNIGVHRFNAFSDSGSDLSFSVAFVNEEKDGVVITGIHAREQTFLYAKPIDKGQSAYMLSPEEKTAINLALHKE